jgi:RNA polymerase sigma factor (sigma-70 family)
MSNEALASPATDRAELAYREHYALLHFIAAGRFNVPRPDAENVVHDVFVRFLRHHDRIVDDRAWLVTAVCNASRDYWRAPERRSTGDVPQRGASPVDALGARVDVGTLMQSLPDRCRDLLRRRFCEGCSSEELALNYATTPGYVKVMVHRCLTAARALLVGARR